MKSTMKMAMITGCMMIAAALANAQTMRANVDFGFTASKGSYSPGTYTVKTISAAGGSRFIQIVEDSTRRGGLVVPAYAEKSVLPSNKASIQFACSVESGCKLAAVDAGGGFRWVMLSPNQVQRAKLALVTIPLKSLHAD